MPQPSPSQFSEDEFMDSRWHWLFKVAGAAALFTLAIIPVQVVIYITSPPPTTALGWFTLFQDSKLLGLLAFELLVIIATVLGIPMTLAFYVVLRRVSESFMAIATVVGLVATAVALSSKPALDMLYLSNQYAAATTDAQRSMLLSAGESLMATVYGTAAQVSYILFAIAPVIVAFVMLKSNVFSKLTAYMGIIANVLALGIYIPRIGIVFGILSVLPFLAIWDILIARRFFQLGACGRTVT